MGARWRPAAKSAGSRPQVRFIQMLDRLPMLAELGNAAALLALDRAKP